MIIARTVTALHAAAYRFTDDPSLKVGFVPTMGALHEGHLSLIKESKKQNALTVCSIFVNPAQFNNKEDLKHYPRLIEDDILLLHTNKCDVLFLPREDEVYPPTLPLRHFDLGYLENIFEGEFRPGHFQGVCKVVDRLLDIVQPDDLYLGQKDYQQCMVLAKLLELREHKLSPLLHIQPTLREHGGLAMSSRNLRLSAEEREKATAIFKTLSRLKAEYNVNNITGLESYATENLKKAGLDPDYVALVNAKTLLKPSSPTDTVVALVAATVGKVRLIDNMLLT